MLNKKLNFFLSNELGLITKWLPSSNKVELWVETCGGEIDNILKKINSCKFFKVEMTHTEDFKFYILTVKGR